MIYVFPDLETLKLCLMSGVIPPEVSLQPVLSGVTEDSLPWVEPKDKMPKALPEQLRKLGVQQARSYPSTGEELENWLQVLPVVRQSEAPAPGPQTPVLFELPDPSYLPVVVGEMLRLSNDRQSFRWLEENGRPGPVLLRVVGPPYYTLLRALDREQSNGASGVRAYVEQAPNIWVEIGFTHPLVQKILPPEGQQLLIRSPRRWVHVTDAPYRDIYEIIDFKLPQARLDWEASSLKHRLRVPLRLIEGDAHDAELWVLRENAVDQLDALVRDAKESLIQRLIFAVGANGSKNMIVLRVRPSKQPPPQLVLNAQSYSSYLRLPNLFLPTGTRLHPAMRRDAIRKLLADDPALITWLEPDAEKPGSFVPQVLPDDAFRPLQDWVDYVLDHDRHALESWVQEFRFDFQPYVCVEDVPKDGPRPPGAGRRRSASPRTESAPAADKPAKAPPESKPQDDFQAVSPALEEIDVSSPSALQLEIAEYEKKFIDLEAALDAPERMQLWTELARRYAAANVPADAAVCWINQLWEVPDSKIAERRELVRLWLQVEKSQHDGSFGEVLDQILAADDPAPSDVRLVVACILAGDLQSPPAAVITERLPRLQRFLDRHESMAGARAAWLAHFALARLAQNDALRLARVRDRLLDRLINDGLNPERDLPNFLRTAGHHDSERLRVVQAQARSLYDLSCDWAKDVEELSRPFIDLMFAFGFARLGETQTCQQLARAAETAIVQLKAKLLKKAANEQESKAAAEVHEVHRFLLKAFRYRIDQAVQGKPNNTPLPNPFRTEIEKSFSMGSSARYGVDRMLKLSMILEPAEEFDPYRIFLVRTVSALNQELVKLPSILDPDQLVRTIEQLFRNGANGAPTPFDRLAVLSDALAVAPRVGEQFTLQLLNHVTPVLSALPNVQADPILAREAARDFEKTNRVLVEEKTKLLQRALIQAANYDRVDQVQSLLQLFLRSLQAEQGRSLHQVTAQVAGDCIRSLRKLGLRDQISAMLSVLGARLLGGKELSTLKEDSTHWAETLRALLRLAGGWLNHGQIDRAKPILEEARDYLFNSGMGQGTVSILEHWGVACTYVSVLGQAPIHFALQRIVEVFRKLPSYPNKRTSAPFYSELHLKLIESVVLAVVNEDFAMGPGARRWLDEDEYLIRRRVHADHRRMKQWAGM